jgi:hypothetical protein
MQLTLVEIGTITEIKKDLRDIKQNLNIPGCSSKCCSLLPTKLT